MKHGKTWTGAITALACAALVTASLHGQVGVGKSLGVVDANVAPEADLLKMPHMTPDIVKGLIAKRNFGGITELHAYLLGAGLTQAQAMEFYGRAFIHVNLNTGTREEILLIPGAGTRMVREFAEYRPWTSFVQFDKEISKYVGQEATDKLKQYVFIPVDLNTASDADILSIPGAGNRMVREFKEYRPWKTKAQFDKEISKYVGQKETDRLWRFVVIK
jgi:DNA uptake protein ComE-like DNA-binding protein